MPETSPVLGKANGLTKVRCTQATMKLATFLPVSSADHVQTTVGRESVLHSRSWGELESLLARQSITAVLVDPAADGVGDTNTVLKFLKKHLSVPFLAYVALKADTFARVAKLSKHGLAGAILHPADERTLLNAVEKVSANSLAREFVGPFEASLGKLPPPVVEAIRDLFEQPQRYQFATDIALESGTTPAKVNRHMKSAELGSAQKLLILAKLLRGYSYLRNSELTVEGVSRKLGYSDRRAFGTHTQDVFGCSPSRLRDVADRGEIVKASLEWFYKPSQRHTFVKSRS